jgi:hypothetical protein
MGHSAGEVSAAYAAALRASYAAKLRARFADAAVYGARADAPAVLAAIEAALARYTEAPGAVAVAPVIHGDAWFANMVMSPTNDVRLVDMRGMVGGELTLNGDAVADFAKVAQSLSNKQGWAAFHLWETI